MVSMRIRGGLAAAALALFTVACSQSDPGITTAVKGRLAADDTVKSYRIDVDTADRVVTLRGAVDTPAARERAVELAKNTEGVRDVVDQLTVTPGATPTTGVDDPIQERARETGREAARETDEAKAKADAKTDNAQRKTGDAAERTGEAVGDAAITASVKSKFLADTAISGLRIDVDTTNNVVTLTGTVPSAAEKARAIEVARKTEGVKSVVDRLKVGR